MSEAYDNSIRRIRVYKDNVLQHIALITRGGPDADKILDSFNHLNDEWMELIGIQKRQIEERDKVVIRLMNELAEREPR